MKQTAEEIIKLAEAEFLNIGDEGLFPNHSDKDIWMNGFNAGYATSQNNQGEGATQGYSEADMEAAVQLIKDAMDKYHQSKHTGTISWEGSQLDGKTICIESITPKTKNGNFRKSKQTIYLNEKGSPMFKTMDEFIKHYTTPTKLVMSGVKC